MVRRIKTRRKPPRRGPLISLAMIVRDEAEVLAGALKSVAGWVDEMIVVDTGSVDDTPRIARALGATVAHVPWAEDFSAARNAAIARCGGRWIVALDADERLEISDVAALRRYLESKDRGATDQYLIRVVNTRRDGGHISSFFAPRILARHPSLKYVGRIHERPVTEQMRRVRLEGLHVVHTGYDPEVYAARRKSERTLKLLQAELIDHPEDPRLGYYLGREYLQLQRHAEAIDALEPAVEALLAEGRGPVVEAVYALLKAYGAERGRLPRAVELLRRALAHNPSHPDLLFSLGKALYLQGEPSDLPEALATLQRAMSSQHAAQVSEVLLSHHQAEARALIAEVEAAVGERGATETGRSSPAALAAR